MEVDIDSFWATLNGALMLKMYSVPEHPFTGVGFKVEAPILVSNPYLDPRETPILVTIIT